MHTAGVEKPIPIWFVLRTFSPRCRLLLAGAVLQKSLGKKPKVKLVSDADLFMHKHTSTAKSSKGRLIHKHKIGPGTGAY